VSVYLVGAGPGEGDLVTLRALKILRRADVVVRDRLVDESVFDYVNPLATIVDVGKRPGESFSQAAINQLLIDYGARFDTVVRLKGGDPFVFGRGGEEMLALRAAGVGCEVVPGLTSALAGPLAAGIPVTHRGLSRGVMIVSARGAEGELTDFEVLARPEYTLVILMGVEHRALIEEQLVRGGLAQSTPVAVIERAWTERQRTTRATLRELGALDVAAPAVMVIGAVAALDVRARRFANVGAA
jgi:uroporphyrin-III C-methyltransferase